MTDRLDLLPRYREELEALLREYVPEAEVWAYGSRVNGRSHEASDLDLALRSPGLEPLGHEYVELVEALEQSNIPILVQAHDWARLPESFHLEIERDYVVVQQGADRSEWRSMPFSKAVLVNPPVQLKRGTEYPFVDMAAVNPGIRWAYAERQRNHSGGGSRFQDGDTLMARITPCLENGKIARYRALGGVAAAHGSTEFIVIRGRLGVTDNEFAYYLTQSPVLRDYSVSQMTGTSGRQRVPTAALDHIDVALPPLPEQRSIAHILGALDDKIELNRQMNRTLEQMARAIFQDWFVDFGPVRAKLEGREPYLPPELWTLFPDRLVDSVLGKIPEGWEVGNIGDVANQRRKGVKPGNIRPETPYIALEHMPRKCIALSDWDSAKGLASGKFGFKERDLLFGKLRPYFHKVGVAPLDGVCSTDIVVVSPKSKDWFGFTLGHLSSAEFVEYTDAASTGTRMPRTNWTDMAAYKVQIPDGELAKAFTRVVQPWVDRIVSSIHESRSLVAQRDALLPKLVSGAMELNTDTQRHFV